MTKNKIDVDENMNIIKPNTPTQKTKTFLQSPELTNALAINEVADNTGGQVDLSDRVIYLQDSCKALQGDTPLQEVEKILMAQAHTLNELFCKFATNAGKQKYVDNMDKYMKLALKMQSQCRATLETLANIKNPPVVFAKQANIAQNQQINNHATEKQVTNDTKTVESTQQSISHENTETLEVPKVRRKSKVALE